ncbi:extracellular solute-binding protein [Paenibacillus sp. GCM10027626]|uniref:extracellular solute-binding protein n=1 Tax=Paenibacillus sp. GCM10027626 TaxID=3273411 RepID=UPI0036312D89
MKKNRFSLAIILILILILSACADNKEDGKQAAPSTGSKNSENSGKPPAENSGSENEDPLGKYDPPIEITSVRVVSTAYKYAEGDDISNNVWTRAYENELGIKLKYDWVVNSDQGAQKTNLAISSGDIPQFMTVTATQMEQLAEAGLIMDLTEAYDKYASPLTKKIMTQDGPRALESAMIDGKLMGIPAATSTIDNAQMLWIRTDWLEKLNLPVPQTMDDVLRIAEAFATQDPDGNNQNDTVGLVIHKDLTAGVADLEGFFNGYHAYPSIWIKDDSGQLVYGNIQPEMKAALLKLQEMYKAGYIDKEFGVKDAVKASEWMASGKAGLIYGTMSNSLWPLNESKANDPNADWNPYPIVSIDDKPALTKQLGFAVNNYLVVRKDTPNPEAGIKMVNLYVEKGWGEKSEPGIYFVNNGIETFKYAPFTLWPYRKNMDQHINIAKVLKGEADVSSLNAEDKDIYERIKTYRETGKEASNWGYDRVFGDKGSSYEVISNYIADNRLIRNEFAGTSTKTWIEKSESLKTLEQEAITRIIMGAPIEEFDTFVENWMKLGGTQITKEVNEWYNDNK